MGPCPHDCRGSMALQNNAAAAPVRHKLSHSQQVATTGELEARRSEAEQPALTAENRRMPCIMYRVAEIFPRAENADCNTYGI